ncbi:hypothetical protein [Bradyrhizobium sp. AUGA SZCCT0182]|uniref:hypothetical protein n=1 Tax=Bradyrhizobium sp. AUGA SZCCT0182 TaxID=2807667 RepID=UPI001BA671F8|nr:hypothetical protein [Bradyrhizobium sp. AUGA SZCCT0182]MBR1236536.1 hypothetical protein [Bradyrhizobium sp. AUGA SZCCT0182]
MRFEHRWIKHLDRLNAEMACLSVDSERHKKLAKHREDTCHKYAKALLCFDDFEHNYDPDPQNQYDVGGRLMRPFWKVTGSPSKGERTAAEAWMREVYLDWDGSISGMRRIISHILTHTTDSIPSTFGFGIKLTVDVRVFQADPWVDRQYFTIKITPIEGLTETKVAFEDFDDTDLTHRIRPQNTRHAHQSLRQN